MGACEKGFCVIFEKLGHAGGTTTMLVHAHHHGSIVVSIELTETEAALGLYFVL